MSKLVMLDMLHVSLFRPTDLSKAEYRAMRRALKSPAFHKRLRRSVQSTIRCYPALGRLRFTITS